MALLCTRMIARAATRHSRRGLCSVEDRVFASPSWSLESLDQERQSCTSASSGKSIITEDTLRNVARMGHLTLPPPEEAQSGGSTVDAMLSDLNNIVGWVRVIQAVDTTGIPPMVSPSHFDVGDSEFNRQMFDTEDTATEEHTDGRAPAAGVEAILENSANSHGSYFTVPRSKPME